MSVISMMEMNAKSPFLWDWENLVMLNTKTVDAPKKLELVDSEIGGMEGFEVGCLYSTMGSDLGYASSSRSSKSASVDSSINREVKGTKFSLEMNDGSQQDPRNETELVNHGQTRTSSTIESSAVSGESLIALELGKRTYFEDVSAACNAKNSASSSLPSNSNPKKSKSSILNVEIPCCQVEGCNLDLSSAKGYHRKHKVCENHSKTPKVVIKGQERRFCQQCSRFHFLSEFDQKKRSCRRRLSDHNARRRKPKAEVIQFNSMRLGSSLYEGRNLFSFAFNQGSVLQSRHNVWDSTNNSRGVQAKPSFFSPIKTGGTDELHRTPNGLRNPETKDSPVSPHFLPSKGASSEIFQRDMSVSMAPSNMDAAQDFRALSLLSSSSWGSCNPEPSSLNNSIQANQVTLSQSLPAMHAMSMSGPPISSEYWQAEPVSSGSGSPSSTFQLFKASNEPGFYPY